MMINKRLINEVDNAKKYIFLQVLLQWISLLANIIVMGTIANFLVAVYEQKLSGELTIKLIIIMLIMIVVRYISALGVSKMAYCSSQDVKMKFRSMIIKKLINLGNSYKNNFKTSEVVQVSVEGIDQLETYFGQYLPQLFYAIIAPLTLFLIVGRIHFMSALILFVCVPLIPITIIVIQKWAKKLLAKYWGQYTALGDTFLENLQGLTTTKIYQSDEYKHQEMNKQAEKFRVITMKVLSMQLNSITVMDIVAYGGAALGMISSLIALKNGLVTIKEALFIILISADFFLPMRLLGSYFHIAMNGMAASDKMFKILDFEQPCQQCEVNLVNNDISIRNLSFSYDGKREILHNLNMCIPQNTFIAIVGESGCGKSTIASLLTKINCNYEGEIELGGYELNDINDHQLMKLMTYISNQSYIFKGTIKDNLLMAKPDATIDEMWNVLERVNLKGFVRSEDGLLTKVNEMGSNLSQGQRQRLALARALLHDSDIYIFDEATANIDVESEIAILDQIKALKQTKTIIMISHRLANVVDADEIYVMQDGTIAEHGNFNSLLANKNKFYQMWSMQQELEQFDYKEVK